MINLKELITTHCPEYQFLTSFIKDHPEIETADILKQIARHLSTQLTYERSKRIMYLNKQVSNGINDFKDIKEWTNLGAIAEHAITAKYEIMLTEEWLIKSKVIDIIAEIKEIICHNRSGEFFISDEYKAAYKAFESKSKKEE